VTQMGLKVQMKKAVQDDPQQQNKNKLTVVVGRATGMLP